MRTFSVIIILLLTFNHSLLATFYKGYFIDNKDIRTECQIKMFEGMDEDIKYKLKKGGSNLKIKSSELKEIGLYGEDSNDDVTIYRKYNAKYFSGKKIKDYESQIWAHQSFASDKVKAYFSPFVDFDVAFGNHRNFQVFNGFVKLSSSDFLILIYEPVDGPDPFHVYDKHMRSQFMKFLGETCPEMSKKVENQKYKCEEFLMMVEDYAKICK